MRGSKLKGMKVPRGARIRLWRSVRAMLRPSRGLMWVVALCVVGAAIAGVVPALVVRHVVNVNLAHHRGNGLVLAGVAYLAAVAMVALLSYVYNVVAAGIAQRVIVAIRGRLFSTYSAMASGDLDQMSLGDMVSRAPSDVETIDTLFTDGVTTLIGQSIALVAVAVAMIAISPVLSAVSLIVLPPLILGSRWLQVRVRDAERATRVVVGELNTQLSETVGAQDTVRAFHREETFVARFRVALRRSLIVEESSARYGALFTPVSALLSSLAIAALLWVG